MNARSVAGMQAAGRLLLGGGLAAMPSLVAVPWVGEPGHSAGGRTLAAALGARDLAIAAGTLSALVGRGRPAAWVRAGMLADLADLLATVRHRDELPPLAAPAVGGLAGASVLLGAYLQYKLD